MSNVIDYLDGVARFEDKQREAIIAAFFEDELLSGALDEETEHYSVEKLRGCWYFIIHHVNGDGLYEETFAWRCVLQKYAWRFEEANLREVE